MGEAGASYSNLERSAFSNLSGLLSQRSSTFNNHVFGSSLDFSVNPGQLDDVLEMYTDLTADYGHDTSL